MAIPNNFSTISIDGLKKNDSPTQLKDNLVNLPVSADPLKSVMEKLESIPPPTPGLLDDEETPE